MISLRFRVLILVATSVENYLKMGGTTKKLPQIIATFACKLNVISITNTYCIVNLNTFQTFQLQLEPLVLALDLDGVLQFCQISLAVIQKTTSLVL